MMKKQVLIISILLVLLTLGFVTEASAYATDIQPVPNRTTSIIWQIKHAPDAAFNMYFTGAGFCLVENDSKLTFAVSELNDDVEGLLSVGNVSVIANDTDIARDLVLGVGVFSPFIPGLFVKTGVSDINELNISAYASAERVQGNFMNGTMASEYDNVTIGETQYQTIVFDYVQDPPSSGDPQRTRLVYDLATGILLYANSTYWFGEGSEPYWLEIEFFNITYSTPMELYYLLIAGVGIVGIIAVILFRRK